MLLAGQRARSGARSEPDDTVLETHPRKATRGPKRLHPPVARPFTLPALSLSPIPRLLQSAPTPARFLWIGVRVCITSQSRRI